MGRNTRINNLEEFLNYLQTQVDNHSIYVWGGQGEGCKVISEEWIKRRENSSVNAERAIAFWRKQCDAGYRNKLKAFDCSGLGVCFLLEKGFIRSDTTADGLMRMCKLIPKSELRVGDFVFKLNSKGKATHIGYVADNDLNVIEAKGRDYGVIKSKLSGWDAYGRTPFWTDLEVATAQGKFIFERVMKFGTSGDDVIELKKLLKANGFNGLSLTNRHFYGQTEKTVKQAQKKFNLKADGKAGKDTITALGGVWNGK